MSQIHTTQIYALSRNISNGITEENYFVEPWEWLACLTWESVCCWTRIIYHLQSATFRIKNIPTWHHYWLFEKSHNFLNRVRTTQSCRHKALLSRRGPDTIEKDLQGRTLLLSLVTDWYKLYLLIGFHIFLRAIIHCGISKKVLQLILDCKHTRKYMEIIAIWIPFVTSSWFLVIRETSQSLKSKNVY